MIPWKILQVFWAPKSMMISVGDRPPSPFSLLAACSSKFKDNKINPVKLLLLRGTKTASKISLVQLGAWGLFDNVFKNNVFDRAFILFFEVFFKKSPIKCFFKFYMHFKMYVWEFKFVFFVSKYLLKINFIILNF